MTARKKPALRHSGGRACVLGDLLLQLVVHNVLQDCGEGVERHGAEIAVRAVTRRDGTGFDVAVADDEHVGDLLHLRVADLAADLLVAVIDVGPHVDDRNEKIGRKIRDNELKRVPYMVIVGEKESAEGLVSMRKQGGGEQATMKMEEFAQRINAEVADQLKAAEE